MKTWIVIGAVLLAAALLEEWFRLVAQNHPWRVGIVGAIVFAVLGLAVLVFSGRAGTIAVGLLFGSWAIGLIAGLDDRDHQLGDYCRYGAASQEQIEFCMARANTNEIDERDTPAARFSRGETDECGPGSGPYCAAVARER